MAKKKIAKAAKPTKKAATKKSAPKKNLRNIKPTHLVAANRSVTVRCSDGMDRIFTAADIDPRIDKYILMENARIADNALVFPVASFNLEIKGEKLARLLDPTNSKSDPLIDNLERVLAVYKIFDKWLTRQMKNKKENIMTLAKKSGVHFSDISRLQLGKIKPGGRTFLKILGGLRIPVDKL